LAFFVFIRAIASLITFVFVNFEPQSRQTFPVLIHDDHVFMVLVIVFSVTHGYLNSMLHILTAK